MPGAERTVGRLRLRARTEGAARRAVALMEDAMRTASLPDSGGRIVLMRRLALGRIDPRGSPQTLALALERGVGRVRPEIAYAEGDLRHAIAVWFRDALDAHTRLALRVAAGEPVDAWYWPLAVRAWRPGAAIPEALRAIALSLAALPEAPSALPQWAAALCEAGHAQLLLAAWRIGDVEMLARAAWVSFASAHERKRQPAGAIAPAAPAPPRTEPAGATVVEPHVAPTARLVRGDPRRDLLRLLLRAADAPAPRAKAQDDAEQDAPAPHRFEPRAGHPLMAAAMPRHDDRVGHPGSPRGAALPFLNSTVVRDGEAADPGSRASAEPARVPNRTATARSQDPNAMYASTACGGFTRAGGLLFLVPALLRVGYAQWLDAQPEWASREVARRVLERALERLRLEPGDPAWALVRARAVSRAPPRRFVAPAVWREGLCAGRGPLRSDCDGATGSIRDASGRLLLGLWRGACPRPLLAARWRALESRREVGGDPARLVADAWLVAVRRWLRRFARIGLADLVLRPASLAFTYTHVDVAFDPACADLRVRRAGLDLDAGWVPWLGRVVTFHYEDR